MRRSARIGWRVTPFAIALAATSTTPASESQWLSPVDGAFAQAANWSAGVPGASDTAVFGIVPGSPFVVTASGSIGLAGLRVQNQAVTLRGRGPTTITLANEWLIGGGGSPPGLTLDDVHLLAPTVLGLIGGSGQVGSLTVDGGAEVEVKSLLIGFSGGIGIMKVADGAVVRAALPGETWTVGGGGNGALTIDSGGLVNMQGTGLDVGAYGGTGNLVVEQGATLDLDDGSLRVGFSPTPFSGGGSMTLRGSLMGTSPVIVGSKQTGILVVESTATFSQPLIVGIGGTGTCVVRGVHSIPALLVGSGSTGLMSVTGPETSCSIESAGIGLTGVGSLLVEEGATLAVESLSVGGPVSGVPGTVVKGSVTASTGGHVAIESLPVFGGGIFENAALLAAEGPGSTLSAPEVTVTGFLGTIAATAEGQIQASSITSQGTGQLLVTATAGGDIAVDGAITLNKGKLTVGSGASSISAAAIITTSAVTTITLPIGDGAALIAPSVALSGPTKIEAAPGWEPSGPGDIHLIEAEQLTVAGQPSVPTLFGLPAIFLLDDEGARLRVIDHVDAMTVSPPITMSIGQTVAVPVTITVDGVDYPVGGQVTWEFDNPLVAVVQSQEVGETVLLGIGFGTTIATVHYGSASASFEISIPGGGPTVFTLASGFGTTYGNGDSGASDPELFGTDEFIRAQSLSADGRFAIFSSWATNLVEGEASPSLLGRSIEENAPSLLSGVSGSWVSVRAFDGGAVSSDGRYVVFNGSLTGTPSAMFLLDRSTGVREPIGYVADGLTPISGFEPRVSDDGRYVLFATFREDIVPDDTNGEADVFLHDRLAGVTTRVSLSTQGNQLAVESTVLDLSADGRYAFFRRSTAGWQAAYRYDRETGAIELATPRADGTAPHANISSAQVSSDGRFFSFLAQGSELFVPGPAPIGAQVYRHDMLTGEVVAVSTTSDGSWPFAPIDGFAMTGDARWYALTTRAANLTDDAVADGLRKMYRRDMQSGINDLLSFGNFGVFNADVDPKLAIGGGGSRVLFSTDASNVTPLDIAGHHDVFLLTAPVGPASDLDRDGAVGASDLAILLGAWGTAGPGDLDGDGVVGAGDLAVLLGAWSE